ncbi:hybrid sensor histidine kinase/response regulator [Piscinibacter koreensis]|nr:ATP-binding protein [Schlegelella koreensis]
MTHDSAGEQGGPPGAAGGGATVAVAPRESVESELRRARDALEQQSRELVESLSIMHATLEASTDAILVTDRAGKVRAFNANYVNLWQLPDEVMAPREHRRIVEFKSALAPDAAAFVARIDAIYRQPEQDMYDLLRLRDGRAVERFSQVQRIGGQASGRVWIYRDVTERERAERALRDETRMLELLNQTGKAIGSTLDLQPLLQSITDAATQLSGASFGAFFYNTVDERGEAFQLYTLAGAPKEAFGGFGHPRATPLFGPTFRGEAPIRSDDVRVDPRYGQWDPHRGLPPGHLPVRSYLAVPVVARGGEVLGGLFFGHPEPGVFSERTERLIVGVAAQAAVAIDNARLYDQVRRTASERERLFEAERAARAEADRVGRMKDEFLATLSHELRTPLGAILGWSHVLLMGHSSPEDTRRALETIVRNANAQTQLIDDLLDMNRIVAGKIRLEVQPVDLASVINAAVESVRLSAEAKEIRLTTILDSLIGAVSGDPQRLQQVVWNLLSNAIKFTPKGGKVDVLLERVESSVEITVSDTGTGIEPEFLPYVFDRFRQGDASTARSHGGLGLGLSIVKQLVELHGGRVAARSRGPGQGATFVVSLPLPALRETARDAAEPRPVLFAEHDTLLEGLRVLVVDDERDARELVREVLERCAAEVLTAANADEALDTLRRERPDLVISDIGMPGRDGYQFVRAVRALPDAEGGRTPAIALTAFARSEDRTRAMVAGYQVHVAKPLDLQELIATVASLAGRTGRAA